MKKLTLLVVIAALFAACDSPTYTNPPSADPQADTKIYDPYSESYSFEAYSLPYSVEYLGDGYDGSTGMFRQEALRTDETKYCDYEKSSYAFFSTDVFSKAEILNDIRYIAGVTLEIPPGPETKSYIDSLRFGKDSITSVYGMTGAGYGIRLTNYSYLPEAEAYYDQNGPQKFRERYGDSFCDMIRTGYANIIIDTYTIAKDMDDSEADEIKAAIRGLYLTDDDALREELLRTIRRPGVARSTHFYTTMKDAPREPITDSKALGRFISGYLDEYHCMKTEAYTITGMRMMEHLMDQRGAARP